MSVHWFVVNQVKYHKLVVYFDAYEKIIVENFRIKFSVFNDINIRSGNHPMILITDTHTHIISKGF